MSTPIIMVTISEYGYIRRYYNKEGHLHPDEKQLFEQFSSATKGINAIQLWEWCINDDDDYNFLKDYQEYDPTFTKENVENIICNSHKWKCLSELEWRDIFKTPSITYVYPNYY